MKVSIDFCLVPLGVTGSLAPAVAICQKVIKESGLDYELGPNGTAIEGEWEDVFDCVRKCHEHVHRAGIVRIYGTIKVNTRIDRNQSFREKIDSVSSAASLELD
tara:strand:- start:699 stop:1010 length:312 start_codon:yes stop_codon:yes gene_type:complete